MCVRFCALLVALVTVVWACPAGAYIVYRAPESGEPLRWCVNKVDVWFSKVAPEEIDWKEAEAAVRASVEPWNAVEDCEIPVLSYAGASDADNVGPFDPCDDNQNLVIFVRDRGVWSNKGFASDAIAMTTLTFDDRTGVLVDGDVELNDWSFKFSASDPVPAQRIDVLNSVIHELGHFFGLDHSREPNATMYFKAPAGEDKKRSLHNDDIEGVCWLYDYGCPSEIAPICPTPDAGGDAFSSETGGQQENGNGGNGNGCAAGAGPSGAALGFLLALFAALRHRRQGPR